MKKHYKWGPDPKLKHRAQMGETTLLTNVDISLTLRRV